MSISGFSISIIWLGQRSRSILVSLNLAGRSMSPDRQVRLPVAGGGQLHVYPPCITYSCQEPVLCTKSDPVIGREKIKIILTSFRQRPIGRPRAIAGGQVVWDWYFLCRSQPQPSLSLQTLQSLCLQLNISHSNIPSHRWGLQKWHSIGFNYIRQSSLVSVHSLIWNVDWAWTYNLST